MRMGFIKIFVLLVSYMLLGIVFSKQLEETGPFAKLPSWCYNTDGTKCSWYSDCLEERYPCEHTEFAYAITYAEHFCDEYAKNFHMFSSYGQQWIDSSKKCLQLVLVPVLSPSVNISCADIKNMAFKSHPKCYSNPSPEFSFCSLSLRDKFEVFWTVKEAFLSAFQETVKAMWSTILDCLKDMKIASLQGNVVLLQIRVKDYSTEVDTDLAVSNLVDAIALHQQWNQSGLIWHGYLDLNQRETHTQSKDRTTYNVTSEHLINVILSSRVSLTTNNTNVGNITVAVTSLKNAVRNGLMSTTVINGSVDVMSVAVCEDINCYSTGQRITAPPNPLKYTSK